MTLVSEASGNRKAIMSESGILDGYETESEYVTPLGADRATGKSVQLQIGRFNRHGFVCGATGTGKTNTIRNVTEFCSQNGVPVILPDIKGDLSGMAMAEEPLTGKDLERAEMCAQDDWWDGTSLPVQFISPGGNGAGVKARINIWSLGYKTLARLAKLSPAQTAALHTVFREADLTDTPLESIDDLREFLHSVREDPDVSVSPRVCDNLNNALNLFEDDHPGLFGGPEFDVMDFIRKDGTWGMVSLIHSENMRKHSEVLTTFLLWVMKELSNKLPEVGDQELPKLVIFIDEAGVMFRDAPKEFVREVLNTIQTIRSKGVGVFFSSQNAADIPEQILEQCANRVQHALRAFTSKQLRELNKTAETFPVTTRYNIESELKSMAVGEALVCVLDDDGRPTPPAVTLMYVPRSRRKPLSEEELAAYVRNSLISQKYRDLEREYRLNKEAASLPPAPVVRVREAAASNPVADLVARLRTKAPQPQDAVPVGTVVSDDGWGT